MQRRQKRAYRYRFYPTDEQKRLLARTFGCVRFVYNWALRLRSDAYYQEQKRVSYRETSALLTTLKQQECRWLLEVSCVPLQQALRHLDRAFRNFIEGRANYPVFKKKHREQSAEFTASAFTWDGIGLTLAKKQKGSKNRDKARLKVARIHARIADRRRDYQHKLSSRIVRENQVVCVESLAVKNLVKNHSLAKAISDVGWGEFVRQLEYKASWYGRTLVKIDRWHPSTKRCSHCGHVLDSLSLDERFWTCPACGRFHDRDHNAAQNILAAGHTVSVSGERIRSG